jgi:hypothetical protein
MSVFVLGGDWCRSRSGCMCLSFGSVLGTLECRGVGPGSWGVRLVGSIFRMGGKGVGVRG